MDSTQKAVKNQEICEPLQGNLGITQSSGLDRLSGYPDNLSLLYNVEKHCWSDELLDLCGIAPDLLPEVLPTRSIAGTILPDLAETLGLPRTVQIVIGSHDQIVNALGAGVCRPGDAVDTSGTCECITPLFSKIPEGLDFQKNMSISFMSAPNVVYQNRMYGVFWNIRSSRISC